MRTTLLIASILSFLLSGEIKTLSENYILNQFIDGANINMYILELKKNIKKDVENKVKQRFHRNKLYYLFDRFIENISKEEFEDTYNGSELKWKVGNYYSLELIERLEDNKPEPANEIVSDIIRYAYSSTKDSSKFVKISE